MRTYMQDRQRLSGRFRLLRFHLRTGLHVDGLLAYLFRRVHRLVEGEISRRVSCCGQYWGQGKRGDELGMLRLANGRNSVATLLRPFQ